MDSRDLPETITVVRMNPEWLKQKFTELLTPYVERMVAPRAGRYLITGAGMRRLDDEDE